MSLKKHFSSDEAREIGEKIGINFTEVKFDLESFRYGMDVELEHGNEYDLTNVTDDNPVVTGKIAWAHLREYPDYYQRLEKLEKEAEEYWNAKK